jgi:hypothetical protein
VRKEDVIAYAERDWSAIAAFKRHRWAYEKSRITASDALPVADELRQHVNAIQGDWPHGPGALVGGLAMKPVRE